MKVKLSTLLLVLAAVSASTSAVIVALALSTVFRGYSILLYSISSLLTVTSTLLVLAYTMKAFEGLREFVKSLVKSKVLVREYKKPRRRYLVFQVYSKSPLSKREVESLVLEGLNRFSGALGVAFAGLRVVDYSEGSGRGILRFYHTERDLVLAALTFVTKHKGEPVSIYPIRTTGTLRKAREILNTLSVE